MSAHALLADAAYSAALSTDDLAECAYAAGVQDDLARHLLGTASSEPLQQLLGALGAGRCRT